MCSFSRDKRFRNIMEVPDPYWSDDKGGFNQVSCLLHKLSGRHMDRRESHDAAPQVLDMLEDSCQGLLDHILSSKSTPVCTQADHQ